jgi:ADP-ribose pyrophosphatase YjhB (NUDIX family)
MSDEKIHRWSDREPSQSELRAAAETLRRLPRGFLPNPIFLEVTRLVVTPVTEFAPMREKEGKLQVLLTQRPDDDPNWPGKWHVPGTVVRSTDQKGHLGDAMDRVLKGELHGAVLPMQGEPQLVEVTFDEILRGAEIDHVYYFKTDAKDEELVDGQFFDIDDLPEEMIPHHIPMIAGIVASYKRADDTPRTLRAPVNLSTETR